ncbi:MAG: hypothetical protein HY587_03985 [Candidatus Omnitrophica bacterium]|nr:hypothetical protein [Candidatus Omnitrophota bacterium]
MSMPIHPYLVHFPVAFLFLEVFLNLLWRWKGEERYEAFSYLVLKIALVSMPFVMLAGYMDAGGISERVRGHFILAVCLIALTIVRFYLRHAQKIELWQGSMKRFAALLLVLSAMLTGFTAHLGGRIAYNF